MHEKTQLIDPTDQLPRFLHAAMRCNRVVSSEQSRLFWPRCGVPFAAINAHSLPLLGQAGDVLSTAPQERHSHQSRQRRPSSIDATVSFAIDEISPKFIAVNGLFRLEDRVVANARDAALKSAMRQISARIARMRFPASDLESSHFPTSISSHKTASEPRSAKREAAGIWSKTGAPSMPGAA